MKTNQFLIIVMLVSLVASHTCIAQIKFEEGSFAEIKAKAKKENKLIFVDCYTSWCGPCKWLAKNAFTNDTVAQFYNSNFINASLDMEKGEGPTLAKQYNVIWYPTLLFINGDGELVHRGSGSGSIPKFIQLGKNAIIPEKQFATFDKKYKAGQRDPAFIAQYLAVFKKAYVDYKEQVNEYFNTQKETDLTSRQNWNIINGFLTYEQSKTFNYLLKNEAAFAKAYTKDSVSDKIYSVYYDAGNDLIYTKKFDSVKYVQFQNEIKNSGFSRSGELLLNIDMTYFSKKKDYENYAKTTVSYLSLYDKKNVDQLYYIVNNFYANVKDKAMLAKAEQWAKEAYEIMPKDPEIIDAYACLLSVNEKKKDAVKLETEAIEILKSNPETANSSYLDDYGKRIAEWSK